MTAYQFGCYLREKLAVGPAPTGPSAAQKINGYTSTRNQMLTQLAGPKPNAPQAQPAMSPSQQAAQPQANQPAPARKSWWPFGSAQTGAAAGATIAR